MSETLWWILQPSGLALVATALAWFAAAVGATRVAKTTLALLLLAWAAVVLLPLEAWLAAPLEARHPLPMGLPEQVDGIVVLGGAVDWRASQERGQLVLGRSGERVLAGAAAARRWPDATLVWTGVMAEAFAADLRPEPEVASLIFGEEYRDRRIVFLPGSASTYDDALLTLQRAAPTAGETWLLITSAWHMPRAWATFRSLGFTTVPYPVDAMGHGAQVGFSPTVSPAARLSDLDRIVREWGAVAIYRREGRIADDVWDAVP